MTPIDFICRDCGAHFAVGISSRGVDDPYPRCPVCASGTIDADLVALLKRGREMLDPADDTGERAPLDGRPAA